MSELSDRAAPPIIRVGSTGWVRRPGTIPMGMRQGAARSRRVELQVVVLLVIVALGALAMGVWGYAHDDVGGQSAATHSGAPSAAPSQATVNPAAKAEAMREFTQYARLLITSATGYLTITHMVATPAGAQGAQLDVRVEEPDAWDAANAHEWVRLAVWEMMRALWTSNLPLSGVTIEIDGRLSAGGDARTGVWGKANLTAATAATLNWQALTQDTAWSAYTTTWLTPAAS